MTPALNCICGAPMRLKPFSTSFMAWHCTACESRHFVLKDATRTPHFDYNQDNEKYSDPAYLAGKQLRWSHQVLLDLNWQNRRVLEIGCFNGFFLDELRNAKADVWGFDVNKNAIRIGGELFNLTGRMFSDLDSALAHGPFDDILCIDVLEHMDRPDDFVAKLSSHLKRYGQLVIAGPTLERGFHDKSDFPPHHKWWFSRPGLRSMAEISGYKITAIRVQRDGMLLLRNLLGRMMNKGPSKEFYGDGSSFSVNINKGSWVGRVYSVATWVGTALLALMGRSYCSSVLMARQKLSE